MRAFLASPHTILRFKDGAEYMKIYLAGENGKNKIIPAIRGGQQQINAYLGVKNENFWQGGESRHWVHNDLISPNKEKDMNIYLATAGSGTGRPEPFRQAKETQFRADKLADIVNHKPYILESFYYADEVTEKLLPYFGDFLLDSGAFTFMQNSGKAVVWEEYIERYAAFINRNNINKFFELDIDSVVGYDKVLEYRRRLENLTSKQCIPVWHKSRGIKEYQAMCDEYGYVAIGGIVSKEIKPVQYTAFPSMIAEAHKRGAKVHGLGFTSLEWLPKIHFDSVDSTAWTTGNRFGFVYQFDGKTMQKHDVPKGKRLADSRKIALINYCEWVKFQKYAEANL